jgi:hypothetical protein
MFQKDYHQPAASSSNNKSGNELHYILSSIHFLGALRPLPQSRMQSYPPRLAGCPPSQLKYDGVKVYPNKHIYQRYEPLIECY